MEQNESFALFVRLRSAVIEFQAHCPSEPLAICASPKTVELLKSKAKKLIATGCEGATIFGIEVFAFEEFPDDQISIHTLAWVQEMLKHRVARLESLRHGE